MSQQFTVRVYGICINEFQQILLSDEKFDSYYFTKFPGGGLEYGEGTKDCLKRELKEEFNIEVQIIEHFYTTDFFQENAFKKGDQILSIYYWFKILTDVRIEVSEQRHKLNNELFQTQLLRWVPLKLLNKFSVDLPIDQIVLEKLINRY
jgi:8-oxo-dGTP diphosphatase